MKDPLLSLAPSELRTLALSLRSGRAASPFSSANLTRLIGNAHAEAISGKLGAFAALGMSTEAMASCLEVVADALDARPPLEDMLDLVTTGPEIGGVANRSTSVVVSELFRGAKHSVLVAGYAVYQGQKVFHALAERMQENEDLKVRLLLDVPRKLGDTSSAREQITRFAHEFKTAQWPVGMPLPDLYCCEQLLAGLNGRPGSLHAKSIVIDDERVFVSSANFTEVGQQRNIEIGLLVKSNVLAERIERFFESLVDSSYFVRA